MSLALLRDINTKIKNQEITASYLCTQIKDNDLYEFVPQEWLTYINQTYIMKFESKEFWKKITELDDYLAIKAERRFFPINENNKDLKEVANKVFKEAYPDWDDQKEIKSSKHVPRNVRNITTYSLIPPIPTKEVDTKYDISELKEVLNVLKEFNDKTLYVKLLWFVCINYETCHLPVKDKDIIVHIKGMLKNNEYKELMLQALFYSLHLLRHEESVTYDITNKNRFVWTVDELRNIAEYASVELDVNPFITNKIPANGSVYSFMLYYIKGKRNVVSLQEFEHRFNLLTKGRLEPLRKWTNLHILGSKMLSCLVDNTLLNSSPSLDLESDSLSSAFKPLNISGMSSDLPSNITDEMVQKRDALYYPLEGERALTSDLDIAIQSDTFEEFITQVQTMISDLNKTEIQFQVKEQMTISGVRFHIYDPVSKLKLEVFKTPFHPMKLVSSFHMPCVRQYYDFSQRQIYILRSCTTALLTGVCDDYNWFSTNKNPLDVILKYAQRGFSPILTSKELSTILEFVQSDERWNYNQTKVTDMTGSFNYDHPFFRVDAIPKGIRLGLPKHNVFVSNNSNHTFKKSLLLKYKDLELKRYDNNNMTMPPSVFGV